MQKIQISLENCYGIGCLEHTFDFAISDTFLVYAPNGTMKSSLAKTMTYFSDRDKDVPCDRFFPDRTSVYDVYVDGEKIESNINILVVDPEETDYDSSHKISAFVASKELKKKYDEIYGELESRKIDFLKKLKKTSKSSDCEGEFLDAFQIDERDTFFDLLCVVAERFDESVQTHKFKYNDVFDKKSNVRKFLEKNQEFLDQYISNYQLLLSESTFFSDSENSFGTYQAGEIIKSISDDSFFDAGHKIELSGEAKVSSSEELKEVVKHEIEQIVDDPDLKEIFDKVDKAIGANVELRAFKQTIENDNLLLVELREYDEFKKKVWVSYLKELESDVQDLCEYFESQKSKIKEILDSAKEEVGIWRGLIETFNSRFHVPFEVVLANQEDVILKEDVANLTFLYKDREEDPIECEKTDLLNILSKGEQRAYYILQLLFDIESRKVDAKSSAIVFDDIADSFDYQNKYAIIEYIKDLHEDTDFKILILTHNFDFYRTIASRLYLNRDGAVLMSTKDGVGEVKLLPGQYVNDAFEHLSGRIGEDKVFVTLIPFLRNLVLYSGQPDSPDYMTLTKCLHMKEGSEAVTADDIMEIWHSRFERYETGNISFGAEPVVNMIYNLADTIVTEGETVDEVLLENKVVLSVAIRLKAEEFMIQSIEDLELDQITTNQTAELFKKYKECSTAENDISKTLGKVILMTPENIHLNAFMYEPLIDMSVWHLIDLYNEVKALSSSE